MGEEAPPIIVPRPITSSGWEHAVAITPKIICGTVNGWSRSSCSRRLCCVVGCSVKRGVAGTALAKAWKGKRRTY